MQFPDNDRRAPRRRAVFHEPAPSVLPGWKPKYNMKLFRESVARENPEFLDIPLLTDGVSPTFADCKVMILERIKLADYGDRFMGEADCAFAYTDGEAIKAVELAYGLLELMTVDAMFDALEERMKELEIEIA